LTVLQALLSDFFRTQFTLGLNAPQIDFRSDVPAQRVHGGLPGGMPDVEKKEFNKRTILKSVANAHDPSSSRQFRHLKTSAGPISNQIQAGHRTVSQHQSDSRSIPMYRGRLAKPCQVFAQLCRVVTGGPGSFVVTIRERKEVKEAMRTKLCSKSPWSSRSRKRCSQPRNEGRSIA
jgi:hypothetical protein